MDWSCFLQHRAKELAVGGCPVVSMVGKMRSDGEVQSPFRLISEALHQLIAEGIVHSQTRDALFIPVYRRSLQEVIRPFDQNRNPSEHKLKLINASETEVDCPLYAAFRVHKHAARFGSAYVRFIRAIAEPIIRTAFRQAADDKESGMQTQLDRLTLLI